MKRPIKGWLEQDALTGWRHVYPRLQRAGATAYVKRLYRRRERHRARDDIHVEW